MVEKGTYVAATFTEDSVRRLRAIGEENNIPNALKDDFHVTIMYSRNELKDFEAIGKFDETKTVRVKHAFVFPETTGAVLVLDSSYATQRHATLMSNHPEATWDHDGYTPHVTLSYDCGDFDISQLKYLNNTVLLLEEEYTEDLDLDWSDSAK